MHLISGTALFWDVTQCSLVDSNVHSVCLMQTLCIPVYLPGCIILVFPLFAGMKMTVCTAQRKDGAFVIIGSAYNS
jgi:hypothetical protein